MRINEEIVTLTLPYSDQREKTVRVFIPEHEEGETFPVIYMSDGQNLFEEETTRFGSWLTREAVREEQSLNGRAAIIVGIHNDGSPLERNNDLTPRGVGRVTGFLRRNLAFRAPAGEEYDRFVTEVVKPEVESRFPVKTGRENTAFCAVSFRQRAAFFKVPREIDVGSELARELECLDETFQHRVAPVKHGLAEFHASFRDPAPEGTVVVQTVGKLHPLQFLQFFQGLPKLIHVPAASFRVTENNWSCQAPGYGVPDQYFRFIISSLEAVFAEFRPTGKKRGG